MCSVVVSYALITTIYRLFLSPIRHFPGPLLAALTFWYEGYYDVIKDGRYTWKIKELHEEYGESRFSYTLTLSRGICTDA